MVSSSEISATSVGRAGEFLTASKLQMAGLETTHVAGSCDLHVTLPSKRVLRVEVKAALTPSHSGAFRFHVGNSNAEVFVLVSMPLSLIRIFNQCELKSKLITLRPAEFTQKAEADDIAHLLLR
jgi:hypothetical protein|tara:strand:+ start:166 stop:537 length:372 start_codon:yes stop_codon:yes gene_type:complete